MTDKQPVKISSCQQYQYEDRDVSLRVAFNNGVEIEINGDTIRIDYKGRFNMNVYGHDAGDGYNKPYDTVVVNPNGWNARRELTVYNYSREFGKHEYPPMTEDEMTKRAIEGFEGTFLITDKTNCVKQHETELAEKAAKERELVTKAAFNAPTPTTGQSWGNLRKAWKAYRIAKVQGDNAKMKEAAGRIRNIQKELGISVASFPHLGIN